MNKINTIKRLAISIVGVIAIIGIAVLFYRTVLNATTHELYWIEEEFEYHKEYFMAVRDFMIGHEKEFLVAYRQSVRAGELLASGSIYVPIDDDNALEAFRFLIEHGFFLATRHGDEVIFERLCVIRYFRYGIVYLADTSMHDNYYQDNNHYTMMIEASAEIGWYFFADDISSFFDNEEDAD